MRHVLIDVDSNTRADEFEVSNCNVDLGADRFWMVRKKTLHGGRQEGVEVIEVDNGELRFEIAATRGMGLWRGQCGDVRLGWDSPVTELVHPQYVDLDSRGGLGWLEGFCEWVNRCGMVSNGAPGEDIVTSNTGALVPVQLTLHGKAAYLPARRVEVELDRATQTITVRGVVDETMMFGPRLRLTTEISTVLGSSSLTIRDEITNLGRKPQEMQILYHSNFGAPLLEEGSRFVAPIRRVWPRDARAAEGDLSLWNTYGAPDPAYDEQVYFMTLWGDAGDRSEIVLENEAGDRGVSIAFSIAELPCTTLWKNTGPIENGYVTGLEPGTNYPMLRKHEREKGRVPTLAGGASYSTSLTYSALTSAEMVAEAQMRIDAIRAGRASEVDPTPER